MKKMAAIVFLFALLITGPAFAEDGFKVFLGYSIGGENWRTNFYDSGGNYTGRDKGYGLLHGPSGEVRFESGPLFVRGMFDYQWGASLHSIDATDTRYPSKEYLWSGEGDVGYKVYNKGNLSITPYVGGGYRYWKVTHRDDATAYLKYSTPYGAVGGLITYETPNWSVGFDAAALLLFAGDIRAGSADSGHDTKFGIGGRAMIPVTYTIIKKKTSSLGVMLFAKPYFEYWNSWKSQIANSSKYSNYDYNYGIKGGIGFSF